MDKVHYIWLLSSVEAILPDKLSLSYEQRLLAHAHYAWSSPPAILLYTSNFLGLRTCRPHLVVNDASPDVSRSIDASPVVSRSIFSDFGAAPSSVGTSGARSVVPLVGATSPCSTGTVLFRRQGVGGFGTDHQMPAVPSIGPSVCFHLKGSRRNCPLHPGLLPFPLPCPYWLHANCVAYMKSLVSIIILDTVPYP